MTKPKKMSSEKLTTNISYIIEDRTIYLLLSSNKITKEELYIAYKRVAILVEDNDLSYISISGKHLEENKSYFESLGFSLSYYDVNKLNTLYRGIQSKKDYKCYGLMTRKDFFDIMKEEKTKEAPQVNQAPSNAGYVSNLLLLFGGIILLCFFCVEGAIYLVK